MSIGAHSAGLEVACSVEVDHHSASTYRLNHTHTQVLQQDIRRITGDTLREVIGNRIDFLFGGPPCQGFSTSNQRTRSVANTSNWLFLEYARVIAETEPAWVVFENVKGLIETEHGIFFRALINSFKKMGYAVSMFLLNAADYGVPQNRTRLFVIGSRAGKTVTPPPIRRARRVTVPAGDWGSSPLGARCVHRYPAIWNITAVTICSHPSRQVA